MFCRGCVLCKPCRPTKNIKVTRRLLAVLSKIFERILANRLLADSDDKIFPEHQFGFRRKHSTIQQAHRVVTTILNNLENKEYC